MPVSSAKPSIDAELDKLGQLADIGRTMERNGCSAMGLEVDGVRIDFRFMARMTAIERWAIELGQREARYRESESPRA
jgi:hypothetical protein